MEETNVLHGALLRAQASGDPETESLAVRDMARSLHPLRKRQGAGGLTPVELFVEKIAFGLSDCWYWRGATVPGGYGCFSSVAIPDEKRAHRVSWTLFRGPVPDGLCVLHRCDVRLCVNPDHLFLGTYRENAIDCIEKGRARRSPLLGEANNACRLTEATVRAAREAVALGESGASVARRLGVSKTTISRLVRRLTWRHS